MSEQLLDQVAKLIEDQEVPERVTNRHVWAGVLYLNGKAERDRGEIRKQVAELRKDVNANPFAWLPDRWRRKVMVALGAWAAWVTLNTAGAHVSLADIWARVTELL